jgi:hypothetical protein
MSFGVPGAAWQPLVGNWDGDKDRQDGIGLFAPSGSVFFLKNTLTTGYADVCYQFDGTDAGSIALAGCWSTNTRVSVLRSVSIGTITTAIGTADLQPVVQEAIARWAATGISSQALDAMQQLQVSVANLPGNELERTAGRHMYIDDTAAGNGWFVDPTPAFDEEFARLGASGPLEAVDPRAVDRIDLLTVIEHEFGHLAGFIDLDSATDDLMNGTLATGVRRLP